MSALAVQVVSATLLHRAVDEESQLVSTAVLHCYAVDAQFDRSAPAQLRSMENVKVHLVTANRERPRWCLVIFVETETNPSALKKLVNEASSKLGFNDVEMRAPLGRPGAGRPVEALEEWLDL